MNHLHDIPPGEVFRALVTTERGLSAGEAESRLHEYGKNEIKEARKKPLYVKILSQFTHFLAILLWVAAALCFLSEAVRPGEGMLSLGVAILAVIFINALFTLVQEFKAEKAVEALRKLLPSKTAVLRDGMAVLAPSEDVVPGDLVVLKEGDKVPADARVVESNRLMVNNAPLTGESDPKPRSSGAFDGGYLESPNMVFAGTLVLAGSGKAVAFATGMSTEFGKIARLTGTVEPGLTPLQREIKKATRIIAAIAVTTGIFFFGMGFFVGMSFWHNFMFAIGIILANVPEGLLPTVTLSLAMGSQRMAGKKALIKKLSSVETLGSVTVICTDKTGTLTQNRMEVKRTWSCASKGDAPGWQTGMLGVIGRLCNNAVHEGGAWRGDPTETAILKAAAEGSGPIEARRVIEVPFDAVRKRMTTVNELDGRTLVLTKGAPETVLPLCDRALFWGGPGALDGPAREAVEGSCKAMMEEGLRVIAFAYRETGGISADAPPEDRALESGLVFAGLMGLEDPPRPEVPGAIMKCREAGIKVIMITGDASRTAVAIARQAGLAGGSTLVVEGRELDAMADDALAGALSQDEVIFSRMTPEHKMRVVSALKDEGELVAVTGDGVNDAPALKKADIGVAMGMSGTDVAREAADMVLLDDNFATIVNAIEEGKTIFENIRKFITYIFAHLTPEAVPYILYAIFNIPLPLTVMQILAIDLGTETIPALALGAEPPEKGVMKYPLKKGRPLIDKALLFRGYVFLGLISSAGVLSAYFYVLINGGWRWGAALPEGHILARQASTATFLGIVVMQVANVFACRSSKEPLKGLGFFTNRLVLAGIAAELALSALIVYAPLANRLFGTAPVGRDVWLVLMPFAALLLGAEELRKRHGRKLPDGGT